MKKTILIVLAAVTTVGAAVAGYFYFLQPKRYGGRMR